MRRLLPLLLPALFGAANLSAQSTIWLRASPPAGVFICGASNATPIQITTCNPHGFSVGDVVGILGINGNTKANGKRKVKAVQDTTHFTITDMSGADVSGNGTWVPPGQTPNAMNAQIVGKLSSFSLAVGPKGIFDGLNGPAYRKLRTSTDNGLTSLICASNVCTVTTSYAHGMQVGDNIAIWNTTNSQLNHGSSPWTVTSSTTNTFSFGTTGVSDNNYTHNDICGPTNSNNCVVVSQVAYSGNGLWDSTWWGMQVWFNGAATGATVDWKNYADGGILGGPDMINTWSIAAMWFTVDQLSADAKAGTLYAATHIQWGGGITYVTHLPYMNNGGNVNLGAYQYDMMLIGVIWTAAKDYLTPTQKQLFLDAVYNDYDDPSITPCDITKNTPNKKALSSGTVGSASTTTNVVISSSDTQPDNYYVDDVVEIKYTPTNGDLPSYNSQRIVAYNATTKTITLENPSTIGMTPQTSYEIHPTVKWDTRTTFNRNVPTTVTGHHTTWATPGAADYTQPGDGIIGMTGWPTLDGGAPNVVVSVQDDTHMTVINAGNNFYASTSVFTEAWRIQKFVGGPGGSCGRLVANEHWMGAAFAPSTMYLPSGSGLSGTNFPMDSSNNQITMIEARFIMGFAMADDDPRALADVERCQWWYFDTIFKFTMNYFTGYTQSGSVYGPTRVLRDHTMLLWSLTRAVPTFPDMDLATWWKGPTLQKMYNPPPDYKGGSSWTFGYGASNGQPSSSFPLNQPYSSPNGSDYITDGGTIFAPTAQSSRFLTNWLAVNENMAYRYRQIDPWDSHIAVMAVDPRNPQSDYTTQPKQYLFQKTAHDRCVSLTGWPCPIYLRGDAVISRTDWAPRTAPTCGTVAQFQARTLWNDHDNYQAGTLHVYKCGYLLGNDFFPPGQDEEGVDDTYLDSVPNIGGFHNTRHQPAAFHGQGDNNGTTAAYAFISRWYSGNHGTWDRAYGDQDSKAVYAMANMSGYWTTHYNHVLKGFAHFKKPGTVEAVVEHLDMDIANAPASIQVGLHYTQNGEQPGGDHLDATDYNEGDTTCPGGCANVNANRVILSRQSGAPADAAAPARTNGLVTKICSPGTITVVDDSPEVTVTAVVQTHNVSIANVSNAANAVFTTTAPHNLVTGERAHITGATTWAAPAFPTLTVTGPTTFTIGLDSSNTTNYPPGRFNGTISVLPRFDSVAHGLSDFNYVNIHGNWRSLNVSRGATQMRYVDADHFEFDVDTSAETGTWSGLVLKVYPGGRGSTKRFSLHAGTPGSRQSGMEYIIFHKVTTSLDDTSLNTTCLNPDMYWTGAQLDDPGGSKVYLAARHGDLQTTLTATTTHSGTAQYLVTGLSAGVYSVMVDGTLVVRTVAVADGDNTMYFEGVAGRYSIFPDGLSRLMMSSNYLPSMQAGKAFQYDFTDAGDSIGYNWSVVSGNLPAGVTLSSAGMLSGAPAAAGDYTFVVQAVPTAPGAAASASVVLHVAAPAPAITVRAEAAPTQAIVTYSHAGLDALQTCSVNVSSQADFSNPIVAYTDGGGASRRWFVAGTAAAPLNPGTRYYAGVNCGNSWSDGVATFTTPFGGSPLIQVPISIAPPARLNVSTVEVQYGTTAQLGNSLTTPCAGGCNVHVPAQAGTVVYVKRIFQDAGSRVVAASAPAPVIARE